VTDPVMTVLHPQHMKDIEKLVEACRLLAVVLPTQYTTTPMGILADLISPVSDLLLNGVPEPEPEPVVISNGNPQDLVDAGLNYWAAQLLMESYVKKTRADFVLQSIQWTQVHKSGKRIRVILKDETPLG
jgi:hypothetical protein